ncbi:MAG: hypothetical protein ACRDPJ_07840 [Nocardioidaceae bacterium]
MTHEMRHLTPETVRQLTLSTEPWLSCEDCFELMDVYVETILADPDTTELPEMHVHLRGCPACAEEAESLLLLVAEQDTRETR